MNFKDHFSGHADLYAKARPHYPDALFDWIANTAPARDTCWDAGCGSGQASVALARRFDCVIATDPSAKQISNAETKSNIDYRVEPRSFSTSGASGYRTSIDDHSIDAITVAQALHWFDLPAFVVEVQRVAKPGALFAAWCYANCSVTPTVDAIIARLYNDTLGTCWPPERRLVDEGYASLELPFTPVATPTMELRVDWNAGQLLAYLTSWSAAQRYRKETGHHAVADIADELIDAWGNPERVQPTHWALAIRAWRM